MTGFALCMRCGVRADSVDEFRAIHPSRVCPVGVPVGEGASTGDRLQLVRGSGETTDVPAPRPRCPRAHRPPRSDAAPDPTHSDEGKSR